MGRAACAAARVTVPEGRVGAGTGATVGKALGPGHAMPGGVGTASVTASGYTVGALAVVNALGDVLDGQGRIIAGARADDGSFADSAAVVRAGGTAPPMTPPGTATTLCVVATDAPLDRSALIGLARAGSTGQARRISPVHTPFDGDITFATATGVRPEPVPPALLLALGGMAAEAVAEAIERAVR
jgi:L-aminopeptidase/D-esterase-like protein